MNKLIHFSMKNVAAIMIIIVMLFGGGLFAATGLKIESMPNISLPKLIVTTVYPGPPQDVMEQVTSPVEKKIANMEGVSTITSSSSDNISTIIVDLTEGSDPDKKKTDIESLLQEVTLPDTAQRPKVSTIGFASFPSYYLAVYAENGMSQTELDHLFETKFKQGFQSIDGFDHLDAIGARETTLRIQLNAGALTSYDLSPEEVSSALRLALSSGPAGSVKLDGNELMARVKGDINSLYNLENLELMTRKGNVIQLKDISKVQAVSQSKFIARLDNKPAIGIQLYKTSAANDVTFSNTVDSFIEDWKTEVPNVVFKKIFNTADEVKESISGMMKEGIVGALLASLTILLFLRNVRMTLIVLVSIPLSILITLLVMKYLNITLNIMTLGGIFIAIGRVVDDSIVVIENIFSRLQQAHERNESVIQLATKEVASAITSSTLATVGVFAPLGMVSGSVGQLFRPFAITLAVALLASLLVALTVIPLLAKLLVLRSGKIAHHDENKRGPILTAYHRILEWSLVHRIKTLLISCILFVGSIIGVAPFLSIDFIPSDPGVKQFSFFIKMPYETSLQTTDMKVKEFEEILVNAKDANGQKQFTFVESLVGYADSKDPLPYTAQIFTEASKDSDVQQVRKQYTQKFLAELPKGSEVDTHTMSGDSSSGGFEYALKGDNPEALKQSALLIKEKMKQFPDLAEIKDSLSDAKKEIEIAVDQTKTKAYGLSVASVQETVRKWLMKDSLGEFKFDNVMYKTTVELDKEDMNTFSKLGSIPFKTPDGATTVYLSDIAKLSQKEAAANIQRDNQMRVIKISAKITGKNKGGISTEVGAVLDEIQLPEGVTRELGGVSKDIGKSFGELIFAMEAAVFVVYLIMVLAFGNASAPFSILFSLPLAAIGGLFGLFATSEPLSITAMIGFMMLIGIVVTNAIVLIDRAQQLREAGYTVRHALLEAGVSRLRPIIMTAGATIVALLPLALGFAKGTLISKGLAIVVIGGLTTSTILTLVVVPVVYELIESFKRRIGRIGKKGSTKKTSEPALRGVQVDE